MPLPQDSSYQDMMGGIDRITSILQERAQPRAFSPLQGNASSVPLNIQQALLSASLDVGKGGGNYMQNLQNYETNMQNQELKNEQGILSAFETKLKMGDAQAKALDDKISLFTGGDPEGRALFLEALHQDPETIDPSNSYQVMTKLAKIKKQTGYESPDLRLERDKVQTDIDYKRAMIVQANARAGAAANPQAKPPSGYTFNADGSLSPIPGGPGEKISAELSARLGLGMKFLEEAPALKEAAKKGIATGIIDYTQGSLGYGESGKIQRRIADGADALQRMLTGAGMPASEAEDYSNRFRTTIKDDSKTLYDKLTNLENVLTAQIQMASRGHGDILGQLPQAASEDNDPRIQAARDAGYTNEEIQQYLGRQ